MAIFNPSPHITLPTRNGLMALVAYPLLKFQNQQDLHISLIWFPPNDPQNQTKLLLKGKTIYKSQTNI